MPWRFNPFTGDLDWTDAGAHTQNTDTKLDEGGANEIAVTELVRKATANITYYIDPNGSDSDPGTDAEPFATIQHAVDLLPRNMDIYSAQIILKDGAYIEGNIDVNYFIGGAVYIYSKNFNADLVVIAAPDTENNVFLVGWNTSYIYIGALSVKIQKNGGGCITCSYSNNVDIQVVKLGDNGNTATKGIVSTNSVVCAHSITDIDANKVALGLQTYLGTIKLYGTNTLGDIFTDVSQGGLISDGIVLNKADYDDAITKKHTQGEDTALGPQSENLDMNTHKIINVVDPIDDQDAMTKLFASNMAINGGVF